MKIKQISKHFLAIVLSLAVLASTLMLQTFSTFADAATNTWENSVATGFDSGSGTEKDPYIIKTPEQFALLGKYAYNGAKDTDNVEFRTKAYKLANDIALNDVTSQAWQDYATVGGAHEGERSDELKMWSYGLYWQTSFKGTLNGNGYVLRGLYVFSDENTNIAGLFRDVNEGAVIKNLGFEDCYVRCNHPTGGMAGALAAYSLCTNKAPVIQNCYVGESVAVVARQVGGFFSSVNTTGDVTKIIDSYSSATVIQKFDGTNAAAFTNAVQGGSLLKTERCFTTQSDLKLAGWVSGTATYTASNCYSVADSGTGITQLTTNKMKGDAAKDNMEGFDFVKKWTARADNFPCPTIFTHPEDLTAPTLTGDISLTSISKTEAAIVWPEAEDDVSASEDIAYTLYKSTTPITDVSALGEDAKVGSFTGELGVIVPDLTVGSTYYFAVVATDEQGRDSAPLKLENYTFEYVPYDDWDGTVAERFTVGDGSAANPYLILNAEQLAYLAKYCSYGSGFETAGKFYKLAVDVNLNDVSASDWMKKDPQEWTVGTAINLNKVPFAGTFDGNGHVIKGLYIGENAGTYNGLFPSVSGAAVIKNLGIDDSYISAGGYSGFIAGQRYSDTAGSGVTIQNCYVGSNAKMEGEYAGGFLGGVLNKTTVKNSYSKATVTGTLGAGSFIGDLPYPDISVTLEGCYNDKETALVALTGAFTKVSYKNCYTLGASAEGLGTRTLEQMTGENAKLYMQNFNFEGLWSVVEDGTPALTLFVPVEEEPLVIWGGTAATGFAGGTGTSTDPFLISTGEQLAYLTTTCDYDGTNSKYYKLTNDIYLNDVTDPEWYVNGTPKPWLFQDDDNKIFSGTLDGDGHTIYGLYINGNYKHPALFGAIGNTVIKNLKISKSYVSNTRDNNYAGVAALAGFRGAWGTLTISNCAIDDDVQIIGKTGCVGGFIGYIPGNAGITTIENCYSGAKLTQTYNWHAAKCLVREFVGGRKDQASANLTIKSSYTTGSHELATSNDTKKPTFENCYTTNAASTELGVTVLTEAQMKGDNAKTNMSGLDFVGTENSDPIWRVVPRDFPELQVFPVVQTGPADQEAPQFAGEISSVGTTKTSITVTWPEATDNITPSSFIEYEVYWSESQIDAGNVAAATSLGTYKFTREATLIGTDTSKDYYFAVKATDESGNETLLYGTTAFKSKASENNPWSGKVAGYYEEGTGTKDDPFVIVNAEQLAYFVKNATQASTEGKYFVIKNDMILNDVSDANWKNNSPKQWIYGNAAITARTFFGHLDAQGHVVKGLYSTGYGTRVGLIPEIKGHAVVENLGFVDSYIDIENESSTAYVGTLAGISGGTNIVDGDPDKQGVRLIRCFVDETVEVYGTEGANNAVYAAGLIGAIQQGRGDAAKTRYTTLTDCYAGAQVGGSSPFAFVGDTFCEKDTMVFERCFTHLLQTSFCKNDWYKDAVKLVDCYSAGKTVEYVEEGVTTLEIIKMIGKDADKALDKLSYNDIWVTTEDGSPMLKVFTNGRTAAEYEPFALNRLPVTVSFATNGADEIEPMGGYVGDKLTLPTITREGYEFEGWYLYSADSSLPYPIDFFPSFDLTLFAKWRDLSTLRVDFETYPYVDSGVDGLGEDYTWYRPGVEGYNAIYVHTGGRSLHRLGRLDSEQSFQLFDVDSNKLEVGKKYELTMWVYADKVTSGKIMLESSDRLKISQKSKVIGDIVDVTALKVGEWQQVKCTFTAQNPYVLIRTSGSNSLYFDDISIYEKGVGTLPVTDTNTNTDNKTDASYDSETKTGESNAIVIGFVVLAASALMMAVIVILKKKQFKGEK